MAVNNIEIKNHNTTVLEADGEELAGVGLYLCNTASSDETVTIHLIGEGNTAGNSTTIVKDLVIKAHDTFQFGYEKFLLSDGERLVVVGKDGDKVSATVTYMDIT
jgi:hypothetical protein